MLLYLVRHAQTASSAIDSFNGQRELPLTEQGRAQAAKLGERLKGIEWEAVYRSPLGRTGETAALVAPGREARILPGLIEINYGSWEGMTVQEARDLGPAHYDAWTKDPATISPPGGETATQVAERALAELEKIRAWHEGSQKPVLAVSHKATLRVLGAVLTGGPANKYRTRWPQDECALNLVELRFGKESFLRLWNDTAHLGQDPGANTRGGK
jgi:broad specificity phosphatase PhoE